MVDAVLKSPEVQIIGTGEVLQAFSVKYGERELMVKMIRYPNGNGSIVGVREWQDTTEGGYRAELGEPIHVKEQLTAEVLKAIEDIGAIMWDTDYWSVDKPHCAKEWGLSSDD